MMLTALYCEIPGFLVSCSVVFFKKKLGICSFCFIKCVKLSRFINRKFPNMASQLFSYCQ